MSKFLVIFKREYAEVVKKKSFIIGILVTPVIMFALMVVPALLATSDTSSVDKVAVVDQGEKGIGQEFADAIVRYTLPDSEDPAYIVTEVTRVQPGDETTWTATKDSLRNAVSEKELRYVLFVRPDAHLADSNLLLLTNSDDYQTIGRFEHQLSNIISTHRLQMSDINLPVDSVLTLTRDVNLQSQDTKGESIPFIVKFFAALIFVFLVYMMIMAFGSILMRSVIEEKTSRIMEVLVSSVTPFQLMLGKVLGLGGAAFTQVLVWVLMGAGIYVYAGSAGLDINPAIGRMAFNPVIVVFFVLFFVAGYIMYSTLFALIGAIVNSDKEAQSFVFPIVGCLMIPMVVGSAVARDPYATWVQVLAYIPFCAPTMMLERIVFIAPSVTDYSLFSGIVAEASIAFIGVVLTTLGIIWVTAKIFRIGILMYGKRPTVPELIKWIRY